jgi:hypothetical protein
MDRRSLPSDGSIPDLPIDMHLLMQSIDDGFSSRFKDFIHQGGFSTDLIGEGLAARPLQNPLGIVTMQKSKDKLLMKSAPVFLLLFSK